MLTKYKDLVNSDVAAFQTEQQRDEWVNFLDPMSLALGTTVENCLFEREALTDENIISSIINNDSILHIKDEFNECQEWYVVSVLKSVQ